MWKSYELELRPLVKKTNLSKVSQTTQTTKEFPVED